jgi:hypothetical protein
MASPEPRYTGPFPHLDREIGEVRDLPHEGSSWAQLARFYASVVASWRLLWSRMVDALEWLHGATMGMRTLIESARDEMITEVRELREQLARSGGVRRKLPSLTDLGPEITANGGYHFSAEAFEALQQKIDEMDRKAKEAEEQERLEKARAEGATRALSELASKEAKRSAMLWRFAPLALTAIGMLGGFVHWLLAR